MKQIGIGIQIYASAYDDRCIRGKLSGTDPALNNWMTLVTPQIYGKEFDGKIKGIYTCPAVIPSQHSDPNFPFCYNIYNTNTEPVIFAGGNFLTVHTAKGGKQVIKLPRRMKISRCFPESAEIGNIAEFEFNAPEKSTTIFYVR